MGDEAAQVISAFSALSRQEQHDVLVELARLSEADAGPVSDEELNLSGAEVFAIYDAEEASRADSKTR